MNRPRSRWAGRGVVAAVTAVLAVVAVVGRAVPATAQEQQCDRATVVTAWQAAGPSVRAAAELTLAGPDDGVCDFLTTQWPLKRKSDDRVNLGQMIAEGGPTVRSVGQRALDSGDPAAVESFLKTGWRTPADTDQRIRVNQMLAAAAPRLRKAAQAALDDGRPATLQAFLETGWKAPWLTDQRVRVNQILAAGGPQVRIMAQRALDDGSPEALTHFIDADWEVAAARDQEQATLADLGSTALDAALQGADQTRTALEEAQRAVAAAEAAHQAALAASAGAAEAQGNAQAAAVAAKQATDAADGAAAACRQAVSAAGSAGAAARSAALAAARAAALVPRALEEYTVAARHAADAAQWASDNDAARQAAQQAHDAAEAAARTLADVTARAKAVSQAAQTASDNASAAKVGTERAGDAAHGAVLAANSAIDLARSAGAQVTRANAAAVRAGREAARAGRAAAVAGALATVARNAAQVARDNADRAAAVATVAAAAAADAVSHAGDANGAAARATAAANAATGAAQVATAAATAAQEVYDAARAADAERLGVAFEVADEGAQAAAQAAADQQAQLDRGLQEATQRSAETVRLLALAADPATDQAAAATAGRQAALALAGSTGNWTRIAALNALGGSEADTIWFARKGAAFAAAQDDRAAVVHVGLSGNAKLAAAATAALDGSDQQVAQFLRDQDYPGRQTDDRVAVNQVLAAARAAESTVTAQRAQVALDTGTALALRQFVGSGQYVAATIDERVKADRVLAAADSGPALRAAAQVALDGPPGALHRFLTVGRHVAAQQDADADAHEAVVSSYLARAQLAAAVANQNAQLAQQAAAVANAAGEAAAEYARQAQASAAAAAGYAAQANASAVQADAAAGRAAASAATARTAAATASRSARQAVGSAVAAKAAADQTAGYANAAASKANEAIDSYHDSVSSANEAIGLSNAAIEMAQAAIQSYAVERYKQVTGSCGREDWSGDTGLGQLLNGLRQDCLTLSSGSPSQIAQLAYEREATCSGMFPEGSDGYRACVVLTLTPSFTVDAPLLAGVYYLNDAIAHPPTWVKVVGAIGAVGGVLLGVAAIGACVVLEPCGLIVSAVGELATAALAPELLPLVVEYGLLAEITGASAVGLSVAAVVSRVSGVFERSWVEARAALAALARIADLTGDIAAAGKWAPDVLPAELDAIAKGFTRYGELSKENFALKYWNPVARNSDGTLGDWRPGQLGGDLSKGYTPKAGEVWDQFGGKGGNQLFPLDTPLAQRALPPSALNGEYHQYVWVKDWDSTAGDIAKAIVKPWFEQPGSGLLFLTEHNAAQLEALGFLRDVTGTPGFAWTVQELTAGGRPGAEALAVALNAVDLGNLADVSKLAGDGTLARLLGRGLDADDVVLLTDELGISGMQTVDGLSSPDLANRFTVADALRNTRQAASLDSRIALLNRQLEADLGPQYTIRNDVGGDLHRLVTSGNLDSTAGIKAALTGIASDLSTQDPQVIGRLDQVLTGWANELHDAAYRSAADRVALAQAAGGKADVIDLTRREAIQLKTVTGATPADGQDPVLRNLSKAASQLRGDYGEVPPDDYTKIVDLRLEPNRRIDGAADNAMLTMTREEVLAQLRAWRDSVDWTAVDQVWVSNLRTSEGHPFVFTVEEITG